MRILPFSWVFFIYFCWILLSLEIDGVSGQCPRDQQTLLLELRKSLLPHAPESKKLFQWSSNSSFEGATCEEGRVTGLDLSNESISGGIEGSLFDLKFLKRLDLSYNNFNSTIPARIGDLASLNYLNLSNAGFVGQVPISISNLTRLVTLDLSVLVYLQTSSLKLENPNLRMVIGKLQELEELYLDGINISASGKEWGQALSSSLPKLRELSLSNCYLSGPIDDSLAKLPHLSVIRLVGNNLSASVPEFFANYSNLTSLHLSACELNGTFPEKIFQVPTLQILAAASNQLLHGSLPASMDNLGNLSMLDLSGCQFNGKLPKSLEKLTQLVYLDLSLNNFTGPVPSFRMSKNLSQIILSHNDFTGEIPSQWEGLMKLVNVDLRNNNFNGSVPSSLFSLPSLEQIQLSNNQLSGPLDELPNPSSSMLDTIDLSSNKLEGPIPSSIFEFRNLRILSLSSNKLNGNVQLDMIQGLHNLTVLDLSYNNLSVNGTGNDSTWSTFLSIRTLKLASCKLREFPYLKKQSKLVYLDLSENQIDGKIPNWIWEVGNGSLLYANFSRNNLEGMQEPYSFPKTLAILDLHLNQFQGKIPNPPPNATYVDFSSNNFTSSIPYGIGINPSSTIFFSLSNNGLTGGIPESICNASSLLVLDLSNNSLSGEIPECLIVMTSQTLGVLNLRKNSFTGPIPDAFPGNCALETLDLNGNLLEGQIPKSLVHCTRLEVLNLGNNRLADKYPCSLKVISNLRVLVLRSNKFHGSIGCTMDGAWPRLQIVDLAHNNFSGTLPSKCIPSWLAMLDEKQSELNHLRYEFLQLSQSRYYQDTVTVTAKGLEMNLVRILTIFTSIDLSSNHFSGPLSDEFGQLKALYALNLSNNALTGVIPSSIGNLRALESLDFSRNNLSGSIPRSLRNLTFLSYLNLSFNHLVGSIPTGNQLQTFSADSYVGNEGLCGSPLPNSCSDTNKSPSDDTTNESRSDKTNFQQGIEFDWQSIYTGVGFGVGAGAIVALLMIWEEGRNWFDDSIDKILLVILPKLGYVYTTRHEWDNEDDEEEEADEDDEEEEEADEDEEEEEAEFGGPQGHYCVFCSKLDIRRKRAIHDPKCTCHSSSLVSSSSSSFSTTSSSSSP